ncbi:Lrp/AsnC family transcriptional regulator [Thalassolituus sp. ST750PaO-4]|uniref:siroheme decarboxylase subunit beta n=1 Tax=Thalassolituus sp. ST750PaO-4 TaxID=2742965 RepID=UPI001CE362DF|nr:Lrp/AsnC family transcriptional regulator [Thalassolituus sp. ST750PaO-4]MCA6058730.1 Lrp/AsnC family transcriptional regulator [Thalassolituus sp. ST750PaO-4]
MCSSICRSESALSPLMQRLMQLTQQGLPLHEKPYLQLARQLGVSEQEVLDSLQQMQDRGVIRRIALVPNHYAIGYRFNGMSVWEIDPQQLSAAGARLAASGYVSHCYQRPAKGEQWPYNLFAMVHGTSCEQVEELVSRIRTLLGDSCHRHDVLYSSQILKKTGLRLAGTSQ